MSDIDAPTSDEVEWLNKELRLHQKYLGEAQRECIRLRAQCQRYREALEIVMKIEGSTNGTEQHFQLCRNAVSAADSALRGQGEKDDQKGEYDEGK